MANLAIQGHATRGGEVIALLEMLGGENRFQREGDNKDRFYYIDKNRHIQTTCGALSYTLFDLEQFEEEFPYKVGDKVSSKYLKNYKIEKMEWKDTDNSVVYKLQGMGWYTTNELQPYKEETMEEININKIGFNGDKAKLILPDGYEFKAECNEVFVIKKTSSKYPKTYKKCCEVIEYKITGDTIIGYNCGVLRGFQQLLICRDAYWKIAGEEMGLNEPWKPDWKDKEQIKFVIIVQKENIQRYEYMFHKILVFPTKEMRDAFYENFKDLIEQCEELL